MKSGYKENIYYFVDESGDPCFYDRRGDYIVGQEGCSKLLMLGFIKTEEPKHIRKALKEIRDKIINDPYLKDIPSLQVFSTRSGAKEPRIISWAMYFR